MSDEIEEAETPLIDQMRQIPFDARLVYEYKDRKQTLFAPVGLMFKRAADEIEELREVLESKQDTIDGLFDKVDSQQETILELLAQIATLEDSLGANAGVKL